MREEPNAHGAEFAYQAIAPVYDDFTAHHDYELWLGNLLPKVEAHGLAGKRLLDVGCGTGKSFIPMLERGWEVTACDISAAMVELARAKVGDRARLDVADMRELPTYGEFDLVLCLDDAINYLFDAEQLERALTGMRRNLAPTGLLMFDVNTLHTYRTFFTEEVAVEQEGMRLRWRGRSTPDAKPRSLNEASFEVEVLGDGPDPGIEPHVHRQRHFPMEDVLGAMERAGLKCLDFYGHTHEAVPEQPLNEAIHTKAVYIARR
jgi:SAM-dependent methyltransferase